MKAESNAPEAAQRLLLYAKKLTQKYKQNDFFTQKILFLSVKLCKEEREQIIHTEEKTKGGDLDGNVSPARKNSNM